MDREIITRGSTVPVGNEASSSFPLEQDPRVGVSRFHCTPIRPINRAPLGHTRFYCQGALFPWPNKTCNEFTIQLFTISQRHHSKWFGRYINHISDHALTLKQTMNCPLIPDSYPFLFPNSMLWAEISSHIGN